MRKMILAGALAISALGSPAWAGTCAIGTSIVSDSVTWMCDKDGWIATSSAGVASYPKGGVEWYQAPTQEWKCRAAHSTSSTPTLTGCTPLVEVKTQTLVISRRGTYQDDVFEAKGLTGKTCAEVARAITMMLYTAHDRVSAACRP